MSAPDPTTLPAIIRAVRDRYAAQGHSLRDIGNGLCDDFARDVLECWVGGDWIYKEYEGDGFQTLETLNFIDQDIDDWDWALLAEHWATTPPTGVPPAALASVAHWQPNHVWITTGGRHYDAETPDGVTSFLDIPFFQRWIASEQALVEGTALPESETAVA